MAQLPDDNNQNNSTSLDQNYSGGRNKEGLSGNQEVTPITEFTKQVDLEPEVEGWLEKIEKEDAFLNQPVMDGKSKKPVLDNSKPSAKKKFKIILPMTKQEVETGLKATVKNSARWLAEWCVRMIKIFGNKVAYRKK